ncbi:MAG: hypothetical protein HUU50_00775 [Candidatus Brocadiae bacterium]|nr:hypothetical protein [Candidatus Brocadiia bacterium]
MRNIYSLFFILLILSGCAQGIKKQELLLLDPKTGIELPGFIRTFGIQIHLSSQNASLESALLQYIQDSIQKKHPELIFIDPQQSPDGILSCSFSPYTIEKKQETEDILAFEHNIASRSYKKQQIVSKEYLGFSVEVSFLYKKSPQKKTHTAWMKFPLPPKEQREENILQAFSAWFEKEFFPSSYKKAVIYHDEETIRLLSQGKREEAIYKLNSRIAFLLAKAEKQHITQKQALDLGTLLYTRGTLLESLGRSIPANRDKQRAFYLLEKEAEGKFSPK